MYLIIKICRIVVMRSSHQCVNALAWTLFYKDAQHVLIVIVIAIAINAD